jgi:KDO2-lipid IV(A) lauroyltransferase
MLQWILRLAARLPLSWLHRAGTALGWIVYGLSPSYAARLRENLYASGVCADDAGRRALLKAAIGEAGKSVAELAAVWFGSAEKVARLVVECSRWDIVERARGRGAGVIFLTPHLGCFEISALYGAQRMPLTVLYRPPKQRWLEPLMVAGRSRWQAVVAPASLRGVRMLYRALARGGSVGLLPDQAPGTGEGVWADFFGRPAYTMTLVTRLQQQSGAAVIMAFAERLPDGGGYRLHLEELATDGLDEAVLNKAVEAQVRRCPQQYLWSYNRYKVPAGAEAPPAAKAEVGSRKSEAC